MVVENTSGITCLLPDELVEFVKKFNLQTVRYEELGVFKKFDQFADAIVKI
jgi:hypothetical protein